MGIILGGGDERRSGEVFPFGLGGSASSANGPSNAGLEWLRDLLVESRESRELRRLWWRFSRINFES